MTSALMTYDDYVALPDDGNRYEVIEGELWVVPAPNRKHQDVVLNIAVELRNFVRAKQLGHVYVAPFDVVLSRTNVVQPDVLFISNDRLDIMTDAGATGAPNLAIEVSSSSTRRRDGVTKLHLYEEFGVDEYWIVDPARATVTVHRRSGEKLAIVAKLQLDDVLQTPLLPGLRVELSSIFED
jgi:Uma2 family endonuclease